MYLVHITTGTHVAQICLFLLTEARYLPARLLQSSPPRGPAGGARGSWSAIDLDLSRYDSIATRFAAASGGGQLVPQVRHRHPQRRLQPDDRRDRAGRGPLARAVAADGPDRRRQVAARPPHLRAEAARHQVDGRLRRGELRDAEGRQRDVGLVRPQEGRLHRRGGRPARPAPRRRQGRAVPRRDRRARPRRAGDDPARDRGEEASSRSAPTANRRPTSSSSPAPTRSSARRSRQGGSATICSRGSISGPSRCPRLRDRREDIAPNLDYELDRFAEREGSRVSFNKEARAAYLRFAAAPDASWSGNFRDLAASVTRMATFAPGGRIDVATRRGGAVAAAPPVVGLGGAGGAARAIAGGRGARCDRSVRARAAGRGGADLPPQPLLVRSRPHPVQRLARAPGLGQRRRSPAQISPALRAQLGGAAGRLGR